MNSPLHHRPPLQSVGGGLESVPSPDAVWERAADLLQNMEGIRPVGIREGLVDAYVDLHRINRERVAIDEPHVAELQELFAEERRGDARKTGQLVPALLAEVTDGPKLYIADGFHRTETVYRIGAKSVYASIKPNCSMDELYDLRIRASASHKSVQFARIGTWIETSWQQSDWAGRITAAQAFNLSSQKPEKRVITGSRLGLKNSEITAVVTWANEKSAQWKVPVSTIRNDLLVAAKADPELVRQARGGSQQDKHISPGQLRAIVRHLPGEFAMQQIAAGTAAQLRLTPLATAGLAQSLSYARSIPEAESILRSMRLATPAPAPARNHAPAAPQPGAPEEVVLVQDVEVTTPESRQIILEQQLSIAGLRMTIAELRAEEGEPLQLPTYEENSTPNETQNADWESHLGQVLPHMSALEREVATLAVAYNLKPEAIATVLDLPAEFISEHLVEALRKSKEVRDAAAQS